MLELLIFFNKFHAACQNYVATFSRHLPAVLLANCVLIGRKYIALQLYKVLGLGGGKGGGGGGGGWGRGRAGGGNGVAARCLPFIVAKFLITADYIYFHGVSV